MSDAIAELAAVASESLGLRWDTVIGRSSGQCSCRLGIWSTGGGEAVFTPMAWKWTADEMVAAVHGRQLLAAAMAAEATGGR